jgi:hypothetical protein
METAERLYRESRVRAATDQISLARVSEAGRALELVRIGRPPRRELAAWRYGDQLRKRFRRWLTVEAAMSASLPVIAGLAGLGTGAIAAGAMAASRFTYVAVMSRMQRNRVHALPLPDDGMLRYRLRGLDPRLHASSGGELSLEITALLGDLDGRHVFGQVPSTRVMLSGADAVRAMSQILPAANTLGAAKSEVGDAADIIDASGTPEKLFADRRLHEVPLVRWSAGLPPILRRDEAAMGRPLFRLPRPLLLALEMASSESMERRAMEGELALLAAAWKEADTIARIADAL